MLNREDIIARNSLAAVMEKDGIKLIGAGVTKMALCPFHKEKTPSMSVNTEKNLFTCFGCKVGGSVIDYVAKRKGIEVVAAMALLAGTEAQSNPGHAKPTVEYIYKDAQSNPVYRVLRYENPKTFRQQRLVKGEWLWGMEGADRVLFRLPEILVASEKPIWIVEGEKDALNLVRFGMNATTNVGGAGKWMDGYTVSLTGKDVVICGDNDEPGKAHAKKLIEALDGKAKRIRHVVIPGPDKDVSDYLARFGALDAGRDALNNLLEMAPVMIAGSTVPLYSMREMEDKYKSFITQSTDRSYSFKGWLPTFGNRLRPCVPGDVISFVASTGTGKTALLQNMFWHAAPLPCVLFEMELADALTFERFVAGVMNMRQEDVEKAYLNDEPPEWRESGRLDSIYTCTLSSLTVEQMETIINRAELKMGVKPLLVGVDYLQLLNGLGKSRYEKMTEVMTDIKRMAKSTGTIVVVTSQIMRKKGDESLEVGLHDAKDSGQVENSSAIQIGAWMDKDNKEDDPIQLLRLRVNKSTRGGRGCPVSCNFDGARMIINERIIDPRDHPK